MRRQCVVISALLTVVALIVPVASADISNNVFDVEVCQFREGSWMCVGTFWADMNQGTWSGGEFSWTLQADQVIYNDFDPCDIVATLKAGETSITVTPPGLHRANPGVSLGFSVVSGGSLTQFKINSALLTFASMASAEAKATASYTVTDNDPDLNGASLLGLNPQAYQAVYNGFFAPAPVGTTFRQLIPQVLADPESGNTLTETYPGTGYSAIGGPVSSMASQIHFSLTPYDLASGTSYYEIQQIPEPASMLILAAGLLLVRRRS